MKRGKEGKGILVATRRREEPHPLSFSEETDSEGDHSRIGGKKRKREGGLMAFSWPR